MKKNKVFFCFILFVILLGFINISCDNGNTSSITIDKNLNGTWVHSIYYEEFDSESVTEVTFIDGNFEWKIFIDKIENPFCKGTYTTNNGIINLRVIYVHGDYLSMWFNQINRQIWYTRAEAIQHVNDIDYQTSVDITSFFSNVNDTYSIHNNKLTFQEIEYTRK